VRIFRCESVELAGGLVVRKVFMGQGSPHHKDQTVRYEHVKVSSFIPQMCNDTRISAKHPITLMHVHVMF